MIFIAIGCSDTSLDYNRDNGGGENSFDHTRSAGQSANAFLSGSDYEKLVVEVDYMLNYKPTEQAIDSLRTTLKQRLNKPGGITINMAKSPISNTDQSSYTADEIRALEKEHRDSYTEGNTIAAYMIFLDAPYEESNVLGIAYYNTSMAFMEETIKENSGGVNEPPRYKIEGTIMRHEFGHILGLVANGTPMQRDHKTSNSPHCTRDNCVMDPAVETSDYFANVFDGTIPDFGIYCREDMKANGGK